MDVKTLGLSEVLKTVNDGQTVEEIETKLRDVVKAVLATGNQGSITLKLNIKRDGPDGSRRLVVNDQVSATMPKIPKPITLFYSTDENNLTRQNPDKGLFQGTKEQV